MTDENVNDDTEIVEPTAGAETTPEVLPETTEVADLKQKNRELFARAKKAEGFVLKDGHWTKAEKPASKPEGEVEPKAKTGELDETQLDYLDLKGISESEDVDIIQKVMQRTGQTVRQTLKDEYVQEKLKANQAKREVELATPSGTKRSGGGAVDNFDIALAKFEQTGELPKDFAIRSKIINAKVDKENNSLPSWHR